jgi:hypothetical protein
MTSVVSCSSVLAVTVPRQPEYSELPTAARRRHGPRGSGPVARLRVSTSRHARRLTRTHRINNYENHKLPRDPFKINDKSTLTGLFEGMGAKQPWPRALFPLRIRNPVGPRLTCAHSSTHRHSVLTQAFWKALINFLRKRSFDFIMATMHCGRTKLSK